MRDATTTPAEPTNTATALDTPTETTTTQETTSASPGKAGTAVRAAGKGDKPAKATPTKPASTKAVTTKGAAKRGKANPTKPAGKKTATKSKPGKAAGATPAGKRKDEPIKGDMKASTAANYKAALKALPAVAADSLNANQVAAKLSKQAGKTVWPIPTKRLLETAVDRGDAVKFVDGGAVKYHLPKKGNGDSA
jgi:hypothetical protein